MSEYILAYSTEYVRPYMGLFYSVPPIGPYSIQCVWQHKSLIYSWMSDHSKMSDHIGVYSAENVSPRSRSFYLKVSEHIEAYST